MYVKNVFKLIAIQSVVERIEAEKAELRGRMTSLQQTVSDLEQDLNSMKEREKLLVEYPDLNGPVNADMSGIKHVDLYMTIGCQLEVVCLLLTTLNSVCTE